MALDNFESTDTEKKLQNRIKELEEKEYLYNPSRSVGVCSTLLSI